MKIHNKGSSKGKDWSFFGKALLWSTALIFVSCGFNKKQETNSNIGDFVDFVSLGISVEEKKGPTFSLTGGFNLTAGSINCHKIDYSWDDSESGYNPEEEKKDIRKVKFIDLDVFTLKVTKFYCTEGGSLEEKEYSLDDLNGGADGDGQSYIDGAVRIYKSTGRADIEVTQTGDCVTAGKGGRQDAQGVDIAGCDSGSTIAFSLTSFNLENDSDSVAAASFQSEVGLSFSNGEPIPAFTLDHVQYMNETYDPSTGRVDLAQVWECDIEDVSVTAASPDAKCSGQLISNLYIVLIDDSSIASGDALPEEDDINAEDDSATAASRAADRQLQISAAIQHEHEIQGAGNITRNLSDHTNDQVLYNQLSAYKVDGGGQPVNLSNNHHGVEGLSTSNDAFYSNLRKYACIYSVGALEDGEDGFPGNNWTKLGAKCKEIVFQPVDPDQAFPVEGGG
jgi:hypothetical protein